MNWITRHQNTFGENFVEFSANLEIFVAWTLAGWFMSFFKDSTALLSN